MKIELTEKDNDLIEYSTDIEINSKYGVVLCEVIHFIEEIDALPTDAIKRVSKLTNKVKADSDAMCDKIYASYVMYCDEPEWMQMMKVPLGLSFEELQQYVGQLTMSIELGSESQYDRFSISLRGGGWDSEHGIYVTLDGDSWEFTDC